MNLWIIIAPHASLTTYYFCFVEWLHAQIMGGAVELNSLRWGEKRNTWHCAGNVAPRNYALGKGKMRTMHRLFSQMISVPACFCVISRAHGILALQTCSVLFTEHSKLFHRMLNWGNGVLVPKLEIKLSMPDFIRDDLGYPTKGFSGVILTISHFYLVLPLWDLLPI